MLGVKAETLELYGAVSGHTVSEMASGALIASNGEADFAIAVSGVAGPEGGSEEKPVGLVYICILKKGGIGKVDKYIFHGNRQAVRIQASQKALESLNQIV